MRGHTNHQAARAPSLPRLRAELENFCLATWLFDSLINPVTAFTAEALNDRLLDYERNPATTPRAFLRCHVSPPNFVAG